MNRIMVGIILGCLTTLLSAAEPTQVMLDGGYVRAMPPTAENTAAYFSLHNHGSELVTLVGMHSDIARKVELHETINRDGQLHMMKIDSVDIPSNGSLVLQNGGIHLMVMGLHSPLNVGDSAEFVLLFADDSQMQITLPVESIVVENSEHIH